MGPSYPKDLWSGYTDKELRERESGGRISRSNAVRRSLRGCICGRGGGALEVATKNSAKESCVAASASVAGIVLPVLLESVLHGGLHECNVELCVGRGVQ